MIIDNISINYEAKVFGFGIGNSFRINVRGNQNLSYDIAEAMHRVIKASGANLRIIIDELSQYLPGYPDDNGLLKKGGA